MNDIISEFIVRIASFTLLIGVVMVNYLVWKLRLIKLKNLTRQSEKDDNIDNIIVMFICGIFSFTFLLLVWFINYMAWK